MKLLDNLRKIPCAESNTARYQPICRKVLISPIERKKLARWRAGLMAACKKEDTYQCLLTTPNMEKYVGPIPPLTQSSNTPQKKSYRDTRKVERQAVHCCKDQFCLQEELRIGCEDLVWLFKVWSGSALHPTLRTKSHSFLKNCERDIDGASSSFRVPRLLHGPK